MAGRVMTDEEVAAHVESCVKWYAEYLVTIHEKERGALPCLPMQVELQYGAREWVRLAGVAVKWSDNNPEGFPDEVELEVETYRSMAAAFDESFNAECLRRYELGHETICGSSVEDVPEWPHLPPTPEEAGDDF